jgi:hypothetical protein
MNKVKIAWAWLVNRAGERSTWTAAAQAVVGASVYPYPYNLIALAVAALQAAIPDKAK